MASYFVRSSGGDNANDGLSFANGWATIQYAQDNVATTGGDVVFICADGTHSPTATVDFDLAIGAYNSPTKYIGCSATGVNDGTQATISGASLPAGATLFKLSGTNQVNVFKNLRLTAGKLYNVEIAATSNNGSCIMCNCRLDNAVNAGIYMAESDPDFISSYTKVEIDHNGKEGIKSSGNTKGGHFMVHCDVHHNGDTGVEESANVSKSTYIGCTFYRNTGRGVSVFDTARNPRFINCVFFANTTDGLYMGNTATLVALFNCIFRSNGGYGVNTNGGTFARFCGMTNNCANNNTSGAIDINSGVMFGYNNVTTDPDFEDETDGSEDFNLKTGSDCIDAGIGYSG